VQVASDKYLYHTPLERQVREMESLGLLVNSKTLYGLCYTVAAHLERVASRIRAEVLCYGGVVHADETLSSFFSFGHFSSSLKHRAPLHFC
jgi:transposase